MLHYRIHNIIIASELPLAAERTTAATPDVCVRIGPPVEIVTWEAERLLADASPVGYRVLGTGDGYIVSFEDVAEVIITSDLDAVEVRAIEGVHPELLALLVCGNVMAVVLALRGDCVLHASAVEVDGGAIVIAGTSGAGKTTLAAALCAAGALHISDDVLRTWLRAGGGIEVAAGTRELRLRPRVAELADPFADERRMTVDGRTAVRAPRSHKRTLAAHMVLIPSWTPGEETALTRLAPSQALVALLPFQRTIGWRASGPNRSHFELCTQIAKTLPVVQLAVGKRMVDTDFGVRLLADIRDVLARDGR